MDNVEPGVDHLREGRCLADGGGGRSEPSVPTTIALYMFTPDVASVVTVRRYEFLLALSLSVQLRPADVLALAGLADAPGRAATSLTLSATAELDPAAGRQ